MTTYTTRTRTRTIERDGGFFSPNKSRRIGAAVQFQYISVASSNPGCGFYLFVLFIFLFCLGFLHRTLN